MVQDIETHFALEDDTVTATAVMRSIIIGNTARIKLINATDVATGAGMGSHTHCAGR